MAEAPALRGASWRAGRTAELVLATAIGLVIGVGGYTFLYVKGSSYLTDNPAACANCHVMREAFRWLDHIEPPCGGGVQ
jgi:cytochrome c nitrite reductase small subunit